MRAECAFRQDGERIFEMRGMPLYAAAQDQMIQPPRHDYARDI